MQDQCSAFSIHAVQMNPLEEAALPKGIRQSHANRKLPLWALLQKAPCHTCLGYTHFALVISLHGKKHMPALEAYAKMIAI